MCYYTLSPFHFCHFGDLSPLFQAQSPLPCYYLLKFKNYPKLLLYSFYIHPQFPSICSYLHVIVSMPCFFSESQILVKSLIDIFFWILTNHHNINKLKIVEFLTQNSERHKNHPDVPAMNLENFPNTVFIPFTTSSSQQSYVG